MSGAQDTGMARGGPVIAVDGPAAAGKGTLARRLAEALGLPYLDTGLLYRAVGRLALDAGRDPADPAQDIAQTLSPDALRRPDLRATEVAEAASKVAAQPLVRAALVETQRRFARESGAVLDGRDIGTVIFPGCRSQVVHYRLPRHAGAAALPADGGRHHGPGGRAETARDGRVPARA
jgi:cytidylate kinase